MNCVIVLDVKCSIVITDISLKMEWSDREFRCSSQTEPFATRYLGSEMPRSYDSQMVPRYNLAIVRPRKKRT